MALTRFIHYFKNYIVQSILGPVFKLIEAILELLVPMVVAQLIDEAIPTHSTPEIIRYVLILGGLALTGVVFSVMAQYFSAQAAIGITQQLTEDLFHHTVSLDKATGDTISPSSAITRLSNDTFQIQTGLNIFFRLLLRSPFIVFGALFMAWRIHAGIALSFFWMIMVLFAVVSVLIYKMAPYQQQLRREIDRIVAIVREQLEGIRIIRAFNQVDKELNKFKKQNTKLYDIQSVIGRLSILTNPLTLVIVNSTLAFVLLQGSHHIQAGELQQGQLVALVNFLFQILVELIKTTWFTIAANRAFISAKRINKVFEQPVEDLEGVLSQDVQLKGIFQFEEGTFTYGNEAEPALQKLNFTIHSGETFGIIGGTGAGKTTLVHLLTQLHRVSTGKMAFNFNRSEAITLRAYRQQVSVVSQQVALFKGTIRSNLLFGNPQASEEQLWHALEIAQISELVKNYPEGLDAPVETFGKNFSGGQRQRLTIARALVKDSPILILDDATSALDYITEANYLTALRESYPELTLIMISQRPTSIQRADQILVLEQGEQVGIGKHHELLTSCAVYNEIHQSQATRGGSLT